MKDSQQKIVEDNTCPKCGNSFVCSTSSKCWCFEIDVPADLMEQIQAKYDGCLCPDCLKSLSGLNR